MHIATHTAKHNAHGRAHGQAHGTAQGEAPGKAQGTGRKAHGTTKQKGNQKAEGVCKKQEGTQTKNKQGVSKQNMTRSRRDTHAAGGETTGRWPRSLPEGKKQKADDALTQRGARKQKRRAATLSDAKMERLYDKWSEYRTEWNAHSNQ